MNDDYRGFSGEKNCAHAFSRQECLICNRAKKFTFLQDLTVEANIGNTLPEAERSHLGAIRFAAGERPVLGGITALGFDSFDPRYEAAALAFTASFFEREGGYAMQRFSFRDFLFSLPAKTSLPELLEWMVSDLGAQDAQGRKRVIFLTDFCDEGLFKEEEASRFFRDLQHDLTTRRRSDPDDPAQKRLEKRFQLIEALKDAERPHASFLELPLADQSDALYSFFAARCSDSNWQGISPSDASMQPKPMFVLLAPKLLLNIFLKWQGAFAGADFGQRADLLIE